MAAPFLPPTDLLLEKQTKEKETSPDFVVLFGAERCGALWVRQPRGGGDSFLSGYVESPALPGGKLEIAVFHSKQEPGTLDVTWRPPQQQAQQQRGGFDDGPGTGQQAQAPAPQQGTPAPAGADDDIPF